MSPFMNQAILGAGFEAPDIHVRLIRSQTSILDNNPDGNDEDCIIIEDWEKDDDSENPFTGSKKDVEEDDDGPSMYTFSFGRTVFISWSSFEKKNDEDHEMYFNHNHHNLMLD